MPTEHKPNDLGTLVERYIWPAKYLTPGPETIDTLKLLRKEAIEEQENHRDNKEVKRWALQRQRAIALHLPWFDGKGEPTRPELWPIELAPALDYIAGKVILG
jgi:hypothetical protein